MELHNMVYDACRHYVCDSAHLPEDIKKTLHGWIRGRHFKLLAKSSNLIDTDTQHCVDTFRSLRQVEAFFSKNALFSDTGECKAAALDTFLRMERHCSHFNRVLDRVYGRECYPSYNKILESARVIIDDVLGPFCAFLEDLPQAMRVTSGATAKHTRRRSSPYLKAALRPSCSPKARPYLYALAAYWGYNISPVSLNYNRVITVPKSWKTDRTIACEPDWNVPLQLAFDSFVKKRLRRVGIDLRSQDRNKELAREGSISDRLATIDLSSASDTLSYNLVRWLLPPDWFRFLDDVRSVFYRGDLTGKYAKFSSMGNGATFALETLCFYAICKAVCPGDVAVYGDDIIVPSDYYAEVTRALRFSGFIVNHDKSFAAGPFRESCGGDYFNGIDVRPFYVRDLSLKKRELSLFVNGLASIGRPGGALWSFLKRIIQREKLRLVPINEDPCSGVFVDTTTAYNLSLIRFKNWIASYRAYCVVEPQSRVQDSRTLFLWYLYTNGLGRNRTEPFESTWIPSCHLKRRCKWVRWKPAAGAPIYAYAWSEFIASNSL